MVAFVAPMTGFSFRESDGRLPIVLSSRFAFMLLGS